MKKQNEERPENAHEKMLRLNADKQLMNISDVSLLFLEDYAQAAGYESVRSVCNEQCLWKLTVAEFVKEMQARMEQQIKDLGKKVEE